MKVFQISSELNVGSVGRIAEQIGEQVVAHGWESYIAFGREFSESTSETYKIGNQLDIISHALLTRLTDRHGFGSKNATLALIEKIRDWQPDIIQLQHMHGYYINIEVLFKYLNDAKIPVVWTFHDCWSFTGHCAHYEFVNCQKWQIECSNCPQINEYPKSFVDNSAKNFKDKKQLFTSISNLTIVPVSNWLGNETKKSFLKDYKVEVIQNGIDLEKFHIIEDNSVKEKYGIEGKFLILGVANPWITRKGFQYFIELSKELGLDFKIMMVGLTKEQIKKLPKNVIGVQKTRDIAELASIYSAADVFLNPTLEDTFPTTNLESQACGTPVITFRTGGSPETITNKTGIVVEKDDLSGLKDAINVIKRNGKSFYLQNCRSRAENYFDKNTNFKKYISLYETLLDKNF